MFNYLINRFSFLFFLFVVTQVTSQVSTTEFFFNTNDTILTRYSQQKLDAFIQNAKKTPLYITKLRLFSDTMGPQEYNKELSERRAKAIKRQLGVLANQFYTEIAIFGKEYDSLKYPLGELQMWRRLEIFYQTVEPEIPKDTNSMEIDSIQTVDTTYVETFVSDFMSEYEKPVKIYTFDTLSPSAVNEVIKLDIQFFQNTDQLYGTSYSEIKSLSEFLKKYPELSVLIRGHVCCGPNKKISKKRAKKVYKSLIETGISKKRISWKGMSNTDPAVFPEETEKDRQMNRRVDVIFSK